LAIFLSSLRKDESPSISNLIPPLLQVILKRLIGILSPPFPMPWGIPRSYGVDRPEEISSAHPIFSTKYIQEKAPIQGVIWLVSPLTRF
jgi:hypothetical protein